jgi:signal transduction histidine kinase/class 3 adenylate cyclase/DNA-binding response OmpR family regulator
MLFKLLEFITALLVVSSADLLIAKDFQARDGVIDLQGWDSVSNEALSLRGDWWIFPERILSEEDLRTGAYLQYPHLIYRVPGGDLRAILHNHALYKPLSIVLHIKNSPFENNALEFNQFIYTHQASIWIPHSNRLIKENPVGRLPFNGQKFELWSNRYVSILPSYTIDFTIVLYSTLSEFPSGMGAPPKIGSAEKLKRKLRNQDIESAFILGIFTLLFLNNLIIFSVRRKDWPSLCLAIYSFLLALRFAATEVYLGKLVEIPSTELALSQLYLVYITSYTSAPLYSYFLAITFQVPRIRNWSITVGSLSIIPILIYLIAPDLGTRMAYFFTGFAYFMLIISIFYCARYKTDHINNFKFVVVGLICITACLSNDMLSFQGVINTPFLGHYGMLVFTIFQTIIVARNFAKAHNTAERLSRDLQVEVDRQTEKLRLQKEKLEEQQKALSKIHDDLKENDEQKTRFFRSISHELRTPLTMILGSLHETEDVSKLKNSVNIATRHAKRLYRLVNQLLDFQKVALSKIHLRLERVDLETFLPSLAEYVESSCQSQGISFKYEINSKVQGGWIIQAQVDALEKILFNYIGNALKFTPRGGRITLRLDLSGHFVRISVIDSGCGIPKDQQNKLFKLFSQIEGPQQQSKQGTGLGLALVKELVQQMEGRAGVESEAGQGSQFWVEFPRRVAEADRYAILLVDPIYEHHQSLKNELVPIHLDSNLCAVASIKEAQQILENWPVQVVLVSTALGAEGATLLEFAAQTHPQSWRVMITDNQRRAELKTISAHAVQALYSWPLEAEFFMQLQARTRMEGNRQEAPILDLVYVDDEESMRSSFLHAMQRYSLIERFRIVESAKSYRELLPHYRIKAVIIDANLEEPGAGLQLLAQTARLSPDTYRVLFTGDNTSEVLTTALQEGHAQYIIYKPADFQKEFKALEEVIEQSKLETRELTHSQDDIVNRDWQLAGSLAPSSDSSMEIADDPQSEQVTATILIVDDLIDMRNILHDILHPQGYRVLHAESGTQALERIQSKREPIDLIITDWMLPGMSGPELIKTLHSHEEFATIPTILLTAKSDESSRSEGMRVGASAYLSKPFDYLELLSITENLLDLKKRERKIAELNRFINENVLQRFLPPALVKDLVSGKAVFDDAARMHSITVLFADLVDFTRSTERLGPSRIARILNAFLVSMTDVIFSEGGTIDKFIGDAILVFFGAPTHASPAEQIEQATRCALRMQEALTALNREWQVSENHVFQMRIGIHHGPAIVGSFGGQKRSDYTAIGHTVNLASRIEGQAKPGEILMTASVRDFLSDECWEYAGNFKMKGVEGETALYRLKPVAIKSAA